ncbi:2-oxoglutarate ferredoxin oxidoreductase subunit gamma [Candidatus Atribacteria bacterium HGW-Atribacteria-1]|nr:MAG: 2-oxoglutarate ferredoxin oxidoreductase subunit gamma [Candidatus Atribacteria bacterium HGW-Atribacteria-1]
MKKVEIRLTGVGGQGVVLSSVILGRAASVYDKINAVQTETYGSDMRGGDVCTEVIIAEERIIYPVINNPDILIALDQKAYNNNFNDLKPNGIIITDSDLVNVSSLKKGIIHYHGSFNEIAIEQLKKKAVANIIMLGFLQEKTKIVSLNSIGKAIADLVPPKTLDLNLQALHRGVNIGKLHN